MKTLLKIIAVLALVLVLIGAGLYFFRNDLLARGIASSGSYALGVPVSVGDVRTDFADGAFALENLGVANPAGFSAENLLRLSEIATVLPLDRLEEDPLVIEGLDVRGLDVLLERANGKFNYEPLLERLREVTGSEESNEEPSEQSDGPARTILVQRVAFDNWVLRVDLGTELEIEPLQLEGWTIRDVQVSGEDAAAQLIGRLVDEVLQRVLEQGLGSLPEDALQLLGSQVESLRQDLEQKAQQHIEDATQSIQNAAQELEQQAEDGARDLLEDVLGKKP